MDPEHSIYFVVKEAAWNIIKALAGVSVASTCIRVFWKLADAPARWATIVIRRLRQ